MSLVSKLLSGKNKPKPKPAIKQEPAAPAAPTNPANMNFGNKFAMASATDKQLKRREEFLEVMPKLDYPKRVELEKIRGELMKRAKRRG